MSSLIANKIKTNFIFRTILCDTIHNLMYPTKICLFVIRLTQLFTIHYSAHNGYLQTTTVLFTRNASLHKANPIPTARRLINLFAFFCRSTQRVWRTFLNFNIPVLAFSWTLSKLHCCLCILFTLLVVAFA